MDHLSNYAKFNEIDTFIFDCDGVLWNVESQVINHANEFVKMLLAAGKRVFLITNNSARTRRHLLEKSHKLGFDVVEENIVSTAWLTAAYFKDVLNHKGKIYLLGGEGLEKEFQMKGLDYIGPGEASYGDIAAGHAGYLSLKLDPEVNAVVVGFDPYINYTKNVLAMSYLNDPSCLFVATNTDLVFPSDGPIKIPGTGSIVSFIAASAGREPTVVGKPSSSPKEILEAVHGKFDCERTMMVGDRLDTDILFGRNCGFKTLLVLTGAHGIADVEERAKKEETKSMVPDFYIESVGHMRDLLKN
ncbi:PGP [Bugula neritina]|uniref:PGP n=1 Tax=Bugula neritina TaxID=10212 RepID=A0A7J7J4B4_BUGNE|nr:PGP [Bugula neritina]